MGKRVYGLGHLSLLLMAAGSTFQARPVPSSARNPPPTRREPVKPVEQTPTRNPTSVKCPTCGAAAGKPCDRRTLGKHKYHMARVKLSRGE